jgi:tRNA(Arg) A34 adenosine deaminase TadA
MNAKVIEMLTRLATENYGIRGKYRMAAGIVYKKQLVATGINSTKSHPMMLQYGRNNESIYLHAEIDAIKNALKLITQAQLTKCDMYVVRVKQNESLRKTVLGMAKPCEGCARAIATFGLRNIYYSDDQENIINFFQDNAK